MDVSIFTEVFQEFLFVLVVFALFLAIALRKGRQTTVNIIFGLYFGLLLSLQFPYYDTLLAGVDSDSGQALFRILLFSVFAVLSTWLFARVLPREYSERMFEGFFKKLALASAGAVLVVLFSHNVLPIPELINITTPLSTYFAQSEYFFWWLLAPLIVIFLVN